MSSVSSGVCVCACVHTRVRVCAVCGVCVCMRVCDRMNVAERKRAAVCGLCVGSLTETFDDFVKLGKFMPCGGDVLGIVVDEQINKAWVLLPVQCPFSDVKMSEQ